MTRSPVRRSNENRHGLRRPSAQTSRWAKPGLSAGIVQAPPQPIAGLGSIAQDLAEQRVGAAGGVVGRGIQALGVAERVVVAAAVPGADPQPPVGPEAQLAAVLELAEAVRDAQQHALAGRVDVVGVGTAQLADHQVAAVVADHRARRRARRVEDVQLAARGVVRGERQAEQPLLAAVGLHAVGEVGEVVWALPAAHHDPARLLDDEQAAGIARRRDHADRRGEPRDRHERDGRRCRDGAARRSPARRARRAAASRAITPRRCASCPLAAPAGALGAPA